MSGPTGLAAGFGKGKSAPAVSHLQSGSHAAEPPSAGAALINTGYSVRLQGVGRDEQTKQEEDRAEDEEAGSGALPHAPTLPWP